MKIIVLIFKTLNTMGSIVNLIPEIINVLGQKISVYIHPELYASKQWNWTCIASYSFVLFICSLCDTFYELLLWINTTYSKHYQHSGIWWFIFLSTLCFAFPISGDRDKRETFYLLIYWMYNAILEVVIILDGLYVFAMHRDAQAWICISLAGQQI